jgi:hypothetical protein
MGKTSFRLGVLPIDLSPVQLYRLPDLADRQTPEQ